MTESKISAEKSSRKDKKAATAKVNKPLTKVRLEVSVNKSQKR